MLPEPVRNLLVALSCLIVVTTLIPASPALAHHDEPPFEVRFPQEIDKTRFTNDWGDRRSGGRRHMGTDLMATAKMVEVYAFADGVVTKINERSRPGRYLWIEHAHGWESLYVHLNDDNLGTDDGEADWSLTIAPGIEEGVEVEAGQLIGWVGDSGNAEGGVPHTHFEIVVDGRSINPYHILAEAFERDLRAHEFLEWIVDESDGAYSID